MLLRSRLGVVLSTVTFAAIAAVQAFAVPALGLDGSWARDKARLGLILVTDKGRCIYRCRIRREECSQDNAAQSLTDDVCWNAYASCRTSCGDTSGIGAPFTPGNNTPPPGGAPDFVQLSPTVIPIGKWAEGVTFDGNWIWAAESGQRTVAKIDIASRQVVDRVRVGRLPVGMASTGDGRIFALVHTDKVVWMQNSTGRRRTLARLAECPSAMIVFGQQLFVLTAPDCSSESSRLVRIDPHSRRQAGTQVLSEWGQALTGYGNNIWIAHAREPAITVVNVNTLAAHSINVPGSSFWSITANSTNVFAGGRERENNNRGLVVMLDPRSQFEVARATTPQRIASIISDENYLVAIGERGMIWVFDARSLQLRRTITLTTGGFDPRAAILNGQNIVATAGKYRGENGAVLIIGNWQPDVGAHSTVLTPGSTQACLHAGQWCGEGSCCPGLRCVIGQHEGKPWEYCESKTAQAPPNWCGRSDLNGAETAICNTQSLRVLDSVLGTAYSRARSDSPREAGFIRNKQKTWLKFRNECGYDVDCLRERYDHQIGWLEGYFNN